MRVTSSLGLHGDGNDQHALFAIHLELVRIDRAGKGKELRILGFVFRHRGAVFLGGGLLGYGFDFENSLVLNRYFDICRIAVGKIGPHDVFAINLPHFD